MADIKNKLPPKKAQKIIREIAAYGSIIPSSHFKNDRGPSRNYDFQDVEFVLKKGIVSEDPVFDDDHEQWKYKVEGKSIDGDLSVVVTVILSRTELFVITMMPK